MEYGWPAGGGHNLRDSHRNNVHEITVRAASIDTAIRGVFRHGRGASAGARTPDLSARAEKRSGTSGNRPIRFFRGRLAGRRITLGEAHAHDAPNGGAVRLQDFESELPDPPSPHVGDCLSRHWNRVSRNPSISRSEEALGGLTIHGHNVGQDR